MAPTDGSRGETADDDTTGADTAGGGRRETGDTADVSTDDPTDAPLPPYPSSVGHPMTHTLRTMPDVLAFRDAAFADHDVARTYFFGPGDVYNLTHPSHLRRVLVDDRDAFGKTDDFRVAFGDGLVATEGDRWRRQRRALQPFFSRDSLSSYVETMGDQARRRVATWSHGDRIDLQREMRRMTLDILFATVFGRELALDGDEAIHSAATRLQEWFSPTSYPLPTWVPTPSRRRFKRGRRRLRTVADELLETAATDDPDADPSDADDLLSMLVSLRERDDADEGVLSDEQLRDQVVTLIFAGHETTAATLALASYELARRPAVRARFHREVDGLDGTPGPADLASLPVTERIVTETLRLYPPVYVIPRESRRRVTVDGYRLPSGVPVWLGIRQIHRDDRFYDRPTAFRPSRWNGSLRESIPDFAYAPFGGGPRLCIGRQFALLEAKLVLATIGRRFAFSTTPPATEAEATPAEAAAERTDEAGSDAPSSDPPLTADMTLRLTPGTEVYVADR